MTDDELALLYHPVLDEPDARDLAEQIRRGLYDVAEMIDTFYLGRGWKVLGYSSWGECVQQEFGMTRQHAALLRRGLAVQQELADGNIDIPLPDITHAAVLATIHDPAARAAVWAQAQEEAHESGKTLTVKQLGATVKAHQAAQVAAPIPAILDPQGSQAAMQEAVGNPDDLRRREARSAEQKANDVARARLGPIQRILTDAAEVGSVEPEHAHQAWLDLRPKPRGRLSAELRRVTTILNTYAELVEAHEAQTVRLVPVAPHGEQGTDDDRPDA